MCRAIEGYHLTAVAKSRSRAAQLMSARLSDLYALLGMTECVAIVPEADVFELPTDIEHARIWREQ